MHSVEETDVMPAFQRALVVAAGVTPDRRLPMHIGGAAAGDGAVDQTGPLRYEPEDYGAGAFDLGFTGWPVHYGLDEFRDELAVRVDSVLVRDGVVRGLVQNMSERLFAQDVVMSLGDGRWVFPLTVQPTEVVPFVIEGYRST